MNNNLFKNKGRKFNDPIPFIIFVILISTIILTGVANNDLQIYFQNIKDLIIISYKPILYAVFCMASLFLLMLMIFQFIPKIALHTACILGPILQILFSLLTKNLIAIGICSFFAILQLAFYFFSWRKRIKFTAIILQESTSQLVIYFPVLILMIFIMNTILILISIFTSFRLKGQSLESIILQTIIFFVFAWSFFNLIYFFSVFIASLVYLRVLRKRIGEKSILLTSLLNTCMALGSITFAGLILALIYAVRIFVEKSDDKKKPVYSRIITILVLIILEIMGDIVGEVNDWVFPYIAIYGDSYFKSIRNSYNELLGSPNKPILDSLIIGRLVAISSVFFLMILFTFTGLALRTFNIFVFNNLDDILKIYGNLQFLMFLFIWICFINVAIQSATKSFLFAFNADENFIKESCGDAFNSMVKERR